LRFILEWQALNMAEQAGTKLAAARNIAYQSEKGWVAQAVAAVEDRPELCGNAQRPPAQENRAFMRRKIRSDK